jgi:hypothetical protein
MANIETADQLTQIWNFWWLQLLNAYIKLMTNFENILKLLDI